MDLAVGKRAHGIVLSVFVDRATRRSSDGRWPVNNTVGPVSAQGRLDALLQAASHVRPDESAVALLTRCALLAMLQQRKTRQR